MDERHTTKKDDMSRLAFSLLFFAAGVACALGAGRMAVVMETTAGAIRIELYDETPAHRDNFLKLVRSHFYDSLLFHRVVRNFVVQAGDPASRHAEPGSLLGGGTLPYRLRAEVRLPQLYHKRGAVAMAREADDVNPARESGACQFYIVWGKRHSTAVVEAERERIDTLGGGAAMSDEMFETYRKVGGLPQLDGLYTVFGEVTEGMDVVEKMLDAQTDDNDRPLTDIRIITARVEE